MNFKINFINFYKNKNKKMENNLENTLSSSSGFKQRKSILKTSKPKQDTEDSTITLNNEMINK